MATDEEIEKLIEEEIRLANEKDITQEDSIAKDIVEEQLGGMGFLWDTVNSKLKKDSICYSCKKQIDFSGSKAHVREASGVDKGVVAFVSLCDDCLKKLEKGEK